MSGRRTLFGALLLSLLSIAGVARAQTATLEVLQPGAAGAVVPDTQYDLRVNFAFAGGDVQSPQLVIDLPPGVIVVDVGVFSSFTGSCVAEDPQTGNVSYYDANQNWKCTFATNLIEVPSGGVSGQIPLRVRFMPFYYTNLQQVTLSATMSGANFQSVSASAVATVTTTLGFNENYWTHQGVGWTKQNDASPVGSLIYHARSPDNSGSAFVYPGVEVRETFPAGTKYLGKIYDQAGWTNSQAAWSAATSMTWTTPFRLGFGYVNAQGNGNLGQKGVIYNNGEYFYSWLYNACGTVATDAQWTSKLFGTTATNGSGFAEFLPSSYPNAFYVSQGGGHYVGSCEDSVQAGFSLGNPAIGTWFYTSLVITPPAGAVPVYEMFASYALPAGLEYRQPDVSAYYYNSGQSTAGFTLYRCNLPASKGVNITKAQFDAAVAANKCPVWDRGSAVVYTESDVTHLVAYSPVLSAAESWGPTVWRNYGITVYVRKNSCGGASEGINYEGYVSAKRTQNGALETTNTGASQTIDNLQYWYTWGYLRNEQGEDVTTQTKGALGHLDVYPQSELGVNPRGFAIFPAGIRYLSAQWHSYNATCDDPDEVVTTTVLPNGTTRIDVDFAPAGSPWNSANDCSATPCKPAGYGYLTLNYYVDPAYPFSDGQIITYSTSFDSENNRYGSPWTSSDALTISVPAEMNLRIEPTCSGAPGSSNRQLGMAARMSNSGGLALTQMVSILPIPKANDGSGTSVSTTYASHTAPAGVTVECSTNNQVSWSSTCNSSATHIRFTAGTIAAYQSVTVQLFLTVPGNTPSGTSIFARGNLDSDQLLPINATSVAPSKVNFCPGRAVVNLWFDEDGDGTRDASEPALSNWPLVLTSSTGEVYNLEFEPDGTLDVALAGGTVGAPQRYTYAVVNPTTGQAVWSWTAAIPADIAVVADGTVTINLPATCACTDNNFCTTDSCNFLGQCAYVPRAPIPNIADAFCDGVDNDCDAQTDEDYAPVQVICGEGVCQSTGMSTCQFGQEDRENGTCVPAWENAENETCDGTDNDCDGLTDAQDESLIQVACEKQLGVCSGSLKQRSMCITTRFGASWQACSDQIYAAYAFPRAYVAANQNKDFCGDPLVATDPTKPSGVDNDCDGSVDEDHVVAATTCGVGACGATGALNCVNGQTVNTCTAGAATSEVCNGKDDDCDGLTDLADPTITRVNCANQDGVCAGSKKTTCNGVNGWADCTAADYAASAAPNYSSSDTTCDARDNNCSGQVDEGYVGGSVACGVGACAVTGTQVCTGGAVKVRIGQTNYDQCTPNAAASSNEVCDGIDNDCDGLTDAADPSLVLVACELQGGVCAGSQKPRTLCSNGAWQPCTSANYTSHSAQYSVSDATCNGVDNNCVGGVDEGYVTTETVCGVGACRATGTLSCVAGTAVNSCVAGAAGFELCNGVDDDCDGLTDLADPDIVRVDCANQAGVCAGSKKTTCNGASGWAACTDADYAASAAPYYSSTDTTCDNRDNNCSGATDEGYVGASVGCGNGVCAVTGTQVCVAGAVKVRVGQTNYDQCTPNAGAAVNETCDGVDNDCDGLTDASDPSLVRVACELQSGVCSGSLKPVTLCVSGSWQACNSATYTAYSNLYATVDSSCNGVDNDCSDGIDDDYVSASTSCGVGACAATGTRSCVNGSAVDSCQAGAPGALELCNGIDDDCDGKTDLADPDIVRENCANQAGVCAGSKKTVCNGASGWQQCSDADYAASAAPYYAADDTSCDGRDNDCSGQADEGFVGGPVSCGNGVCAVTGNQVCVAGAIKVRIGQAVLDQCAPNAGAATNEVCDGLDNDCDGFVDAADPSLVKVNCEQQGGVCAGAQKAATLCVNGAWQACNSTTYSAHSQLYSSVDTTCNGVDNDCTGGTDDDYVAPLTACGVGRCAGTTGRMQCTNGQVADTCNPTANAVAELCNGQDDDCDGSTDETFQVGAACSVGQFACTSQGHFVCSGNGQGVVCDAQVINGTTESCDARDNDCDGATDEDFDLGASCTVGVGACARTGVRVCIINGAAGCSVTAGVGSAEICDGVDNDCNGRTDDGVCRLDTVISNGPDEVVSVSTAAFTFVDSVNPTNTHFECQFDGGAWFTCDGGVLVLNEVGDGAHTVLVRAVGPTGVVDDTPAYWSWEVDTTVPDTFVLAGPQNPSQSPEAAFVFGTNVANPSAWYCAVDPVGGAPSESEWSPCAATWTWASLTEGEHTVWVYVVNDLGIADTTPASYTWLIDTTAPGTSIISGPSAVSCEVGATFTFESPDDGEVASFRCRLDAAEWVPCALGTITFAGLSDGRHLFSVAAVDANGNVDPTPAQFSWRVDTIAPNTSIDLKPQDPAQNSVATFAFSADEAGATFTCRLDAGPAVPCQSPVSFNGLADGSHTFSVYASDLGCKSDESPATYTWLVDTRFPDTAYLTTPPVLNGFDDPNSFTYEDPTAPANTTFECSLDGAAWTPCNGGSLQAGVLAIGQHTLSVKTCERLSDAVVQCDPTPAVYGWQVTASPCPLDREAPILGCIEGPVLECVAGGATFEVGALSPAASDDCAPLAVTTSHEGTAPLGVSPVVFSAVDGNGNASSCVTLVSVVDTQPPQITCPVAVELEAPADACGAVYDLGAAVAVDACFGTNVSTYSNAPAVFGVGETTVTYTALDASGNASTCTTKVVVLDKTPVALTCDSEVTRVAPASACAWTGTLTATATDNCAVDVTVVERSNTYNVGVQAVEFTARDDSGNTAACETTLTVVDETAPVVDCGTLTGPVPATVTVTATDACTAIAAVTGFTCTRIAADGVRTELADEDCAVSFEGAVLSIDARLASGELEVGYGVEASDPAGNRTTRECVVSLVADLDRDGLIDELDNCPSTANTDQADTDDDGLGDVCDVCPTVSDADQVDSDANGIGDACQDTDEDTILDLVDNCPLDANTAQLDFDHDGLGNECDPVDDEIVAGGSGSLGCAGVAGGGLGAMFGVVVLLAWRMRRARAARRSGLA